jgi:hypothetical protein
MTTRHLTTAAVVAALVSLAGILVGLSDPAYYDPVTAIDYLAAALNTAGPFAASVVLVVWWKVVPVRRARWLVLGAAISVFVMGLGNFIEDVLELDWGGDLFTFGFGAFALGAVAGIVTLTASGRWRWSGLFLLGFAASLGFDAGELAFINWTVLAVLLSRGFFEVETDPA